MHAPLPQPTQSPGPVRQHSEGEYRYELLPDLSILIYKSGQLSYSITPSGECECPGFRHRGRCKHSERGEQMVQAYLNRRWQA